jgi:tripartite-type tricarboxylate transporter receptor subunit TctC
MAWRNGLTVAAIAVMFGAGHAAAARQANAYPNRPIRMVVGFTPGGQPDITARMIAPKLYEALGQQVIVDNRPGAGSIIGAKIVAESAPDGYTLLFASSSHVASPAVHAKLPYDTIRDFAGITITSTACYVLVVTPSLPIDKLNREVSRALQQPDIRQRLIAMGAEPGSMNPADYDKLIAEQVAMTIKLARQAGIKPD